MRGTYVVTILRAPETFAYQQGTRLDDMVTKALESFERELNVDGDPKKTQNGYNAVDLLKSKSPLR